MNYTVVMGDLTWAAIVAGCFGVISLYVQHRLNRPLKRRMDKVDTAIGNPNGQGNVVQMIEQLLESERQRLYWQQATDTRLGRVEDDVLALQRRSSL